MNPMMRLSALLFTTSISNPKPPNRAISRRSFLGTTLAVGGVVFVMVAIAQSALAQNSVMTQNLVRFSGGIGVIPTGSANTTVRGVAAAGQIWVIRDLAADVKQDGGIRLDSRGLLLGSGNAVGSNANASVIATLFCANDGNIQHSSNLAGVPLEVNGDFRIDDTLSPAPPNPCTSPVLLIRSAGSGSWFAAGIPR
jgi:hypothetical protein